MLPAIISISAFFAIFIGCFCVYLIIEKQKSIKLQSQRLEFAVNPVAISSIQGQKTEDSNSLEGEEGDLRRDTSTSSIPWLDKLLRKYLKGRANHLLTLIEQSGLKIKVSEFLLFTVLISLIGVLVVDLFFHVPLAGIIIGFVPWGILNILKAKRLEAFIAQMPAALDMLSSDLRAGVDVQTGFKHLSDEFPAPIGEEFAKVVAEINLGLHLKDALQNLANRVNSTEVQILCTGVIINRELGGNLSELVGNVSNTIRERFRLKGMIKALTAENQMSAYLLIALPFALYFILNMLAPDTYNSFASDPTGQKIIIGCLVSMTIGYVVMNKITQLEV
jgi:tight adherence protein B